MSALSNGLAARDKATPGPWKFGGCAVWKWDGDILADLAFAHNTPTNTEANAILMTAAPDALDWIAKALPFMKLDLERRRFADYDDGENKAYGDRDIATLTALIAQAEGKKEGENEN